MSIAIIGLGGAGGNVANEASKMGIVSGAINFSQKDLDSLDSVKHKLKLIGSDGVGHDRSLAIELVQECYPMIVKFIKDNFDNPSIDILFFPFATGGGSGSGMAPILCDILSEVTDKVIVPIPILADEFEVLIAQTNTYETMNELSRLNLFVLPIDNHEVKTHNKAFKNRLFEIANTTIVSLLKRLVEYTEMSSRNGNFDHKDLITIFTQKGIGAIAETDITSLPKANLTSKGIAESIYNSWETSIFAPIEYEQVAKCAFIFDGQESLIEHVNYREIFSSFTLGQPLDIFEGYYEVHNGKILTVLSGLSWCNARMESMDRLIENEKEKANNMINNMENEQFKAKTFDFSQKLRENGKKSVKIGSVSDILSKYKR